MAARQTPPGARPSRTVRRLPAKVQVGRSDGWSSTTRSGLQACYGGGSRFGSPRYVSRVRFSLLYELQLPRPWEAGAERRLIAEALDQLATADRLGFHAAWVLEHQFA